MSNPCRRTTFGEDDVDIFDGIAYCIGCRYKVSDHQTPSPTPQDDLQPLDPELDDMFYRYRIAKNNGERRLIEQEFITYAQKAHEDGYREALNMVKSDIDYDLSRSFNKAKREAING